MLPNANLPTNLNKKPHNRKKPTFCKGFLCSKSVKVDSCNELKYSKSLKLLSQLTFKACSSKEVNTLCTCCRATGGRKTHAGSSHSLLFKLVAPGILGFTLPPPGSD